jgi:hypothetical protein
MGGRGLDLPGSEQELETPLCEQVFGLSNMREISRLTNCYLLKRIFDPWSSF